MKHEKKRMIKIIDEVMTFFYTLGAKNVSIDITDSDDCYSMLFKTDYREKCKDKISKLVKALQRCSVQKEMEEYYWELVGDCDIDSELSLLSMMINKAEIEINDDTIELKLMRYKD